MISFDLKINLLKFQTLLKELEKDVFLNIDWIFSKINAFDIQQVLYDFDLYKENEEINIVRECLKMSEPGIAENSRFLFNELAGRLLPFYHLYSRLQSLVDQCDHLSLRLNPIIPIGQTFSSPAWIVENDVDLKLDMNDPLYLDLLESDFNGRILFAKNAGERLAKFFDLDLMESMNDVEIGQGRGIL